MPQISNIIMLTDGSTLSLGGVVYTWNLSSLWLDIPLLNTRGRITSQVEERFSSVDQHQSQQQRYVHMFTIQQPCTDCAMTIFWELLIVNFCLLTYYYSSFLILLVRCFIYFIYLFNPQLDTMQMRTYNSKTLNCKHANCKTSRQSTNRCLHY